MPENRNMSATLSGETLVATTARECLQGGVLSPLLWSLVVDDLPWGLNSNDYCTVGYADDIAILINWKFPLTNSPMHSSTVVRKNPNKTVVMPFTSKSNIKGLDEPAFFGGKSIQLSSEVKYLGLILDKGLTWKKQLDKVNVKAYKAFWICRDIFGKTWGLKPNVLYWIHTAVVRPVVTYAATIWWPRVKLKTSQVVLSKLQRMACLRIIGAMRSVSTAAISVLLGLPPLHLQLEEEARIGNYRLRCNE
jgi:hypothetical protein